MKYLYLSIVNGLIIQKRQIQEIQTSSVSNAGNGMYRTARDEQPRQIGYSRLWNNLRSDSKQANQSNENPNAFAQDYNRNLAFTQAEIISPNANVHIINAYPQAQELNRNAYPVEKSLAQAQDSISTVYPESSIKADQNPNIHKDITVGTGLIADAIIHTESSIPASSNFKSKVIDATMHSSNNIASTIRDDEWNNIHGFSVNPSVQYYDLLEKEASMPDDKLVASIQPNWPAAATSTQKNSSVQPSSTTKTVQPSFTAIPTVQQSSIATPTVQKSSTATPTTAVQSSYATPTLKLTSIKHNSTSGTQVTPSDSKKLSSYLQVTPEMELMITSLMSGKDSVGMNNLLEKSKNNQDIGRYENTNITSAATLAPGDKAGAKKPHHSQSYGKSGIASDQSTKVTDFDHELIAKPDRNLAIIALAAELAAKSASGESLGENLGLDTRLSLLTGNTDTLGAKVAMGAAKKSSDAKKSDINQNLAKFDATSLGLGKLARI